jgi:hypothetical protein
MCTSLSVSCYGYDPKPSWADGGVRQREKAEELRWEIKVASSRNRRRTMQQKKQIMALSDVEQSEERFDTSSEAESEHDDINTPPFIFNPTTGATRSGTDHNLQLLDKSPAQSSQDLDPLMHGQTSREISHPGVFDMSLIGLETVSAGQDISMSSMELQDSQANLLMHYLDHVFPLQFQLYNPPISDGGRGWLLSILLRNKALCHAALSLAAYHLASSHCTGPLECGKRYVLEVLEKRRNLAIAELRIDLDKFHEEEQANNLERNVEVLACIVLLITLEVGLALELVPVWI